MLNKLTNRKVIIALIAVAVVFVVAYIFLDKRYEFGQSLLQQSSASSTGNDVSESESYLTASEQVATDSPESELVPAETAPQQVEINSSSIDKKEVSVLFNYTILGDGSSVKLAPVQSSVEADIVKLSIKLNCESSCRFKLASDAYPLTSSKTYTSSQTIEYTLNKPGEWVFYNEYIPGPRFKISF